jgi:hypothetical protein
MIKKEKKKLISNIVSFEKENNCFPLFSFGKSFLKTYLGGGYNFSGLMGIHI